MHSHTDSTNQYRRRKVGRTGPSINVQAYPGSLFKGSPGLVNGCGVTGSLLLRDDQDLISIRKYILSKNVHRTIAGEDVRRVRLLIVSLNLRT